MKRHLKKWMMVMALAAAMSMAAGCGNSGRNTDKNGAGNHR